MHLSVNYDSVKSVVSDLVEYHSTSHASQKFEAQPTTSGLGPTRPDNGLIALAQKTAISASTTPYQPHYLQLVVTIRPGNNI